MLASPQGSPSTSSWTPTLPPRPPQSRRGARRPHSQVHCTPPSASWLKQVERWVAELTRKQLRRGVPTATSQLEADIRAFIATHNATPQPFKWTKSADAILAAGKRCGHRGDHHSCHEL